MNLEQAMLVVVGAADVHLGTACSDLNPPSVRTRAASDARLLLSAITDQQRAQWMLDTGWTRVLMAGVYTVDTVTPAMRVLADTPRTQVEVSRGTPAPVPERCTCGERGWKPVGVGAMQTWAFNHLPDCPLSRVHGAVKSK